MKLLEECVERKLSMSEPGPQRPRRHLVRKLASATVIRPWVLAALVLLVAASSLHAQELGQFVLIDATFTATAQNTEKSQYTVAPLAAAPANWTSPIDYRQGSIFVRFEILEKPTTKSTLCNVCFENSGTLTCMPYPPAYTRPSVFTSAPTMKTFWQFDVYDWTKKVDHVYVVVKDGTNEKLVQGDSQFFPSKMHITVTVVPPGKEYVAPIGDDEDGDADAGVRAVAPMPTTSADQPKPAGLPAAAPGIVTAGAQAVAAAAAAGTSAALAGRAGTAAGSAGKLAPLPDAGPHRDIRDYIDPGSNCSLCVPRSRADWRVLAPLAIVALRLRRRRTR
jgi:hypothetical protein